MKDWTEAVVRLYFYYSYCHSPAQIERSEREG
jgi:hypothetical protein